MLRESVGFSQKKIAKLFGAGQSSIYRYESGEASAPYHILIQYADFFDVSLDYIYVTKKEHRKMLVDTFINVIFLYGDKVVITFNYREGGKTITLEDVTSSDIELAGAPRNPLIIQGIRL